MAKISVLGAMKGGVGKSVSTFNLAYSLAELGKKVLEFVVLQLANFMFREIIEDAHTKYNISDEDMEAMCKKAVNRAMVYVNSQKSRDKAKRDAFLIYALYGLEWDDAETTDDVIKQYELLKGCEEILRDVQQKH